MLKLCSGIKSHGKESRRKLGDIIKKIKEIKQTALLG